MRTLITNGTVLDTEPEPRVLPGADLLIEGGVIAAVGPALAVPPDTEVIDAGGQIVLPGLVDTHRHLWQSLIRSAAVGATLGEYLALVLGRYAPAYTPEEVRVANLWGAFEALDAGITTLYDWSHIQLTPGHTDAALDGLRESGIRAIFGYAHPGERRPGELRRVRDLLGDGGLITPALAATGPVYGPVEDAVEDWRLARELGLPISMHGTGAGLVEALDEHGLLGSDLLFVHGNGFPENAVKLVAEHGGAASVAPAVEAQMGHGMPETGRFREAGIVTGLGVDTVVTVPGDMFNVMRAAYQTERLRSPITAAEVLRMATIEGATAIGLGDRVGSLTPGKQADLILIGTDRPGLTPMHDPVAAVLSATPADVRTVLVAGTVRKRDGRLVGAPSRDLVLQASERIT